MSEVMDRMMASATEIIRAMLKTAAQDGSEEQAQALNEAESYLRDWDMPLVDPLAFAVATQEPFHNGKPLWVYLADHPEMANVALALLEAYLKHRRGMLVSGSMPPPQTDHAVALKQFAREMLVHAFDATDADGWEIQDVAERLGLIKKVKYDPAEHGPSDVCEAGDDWYVQTF